MNGVRMGANALSMISSWSFRLCWSCANRVRGSCTVNVHNWDDLGLPDRKVLPSRALLCVRLSGRERGSWTALLARRCGDHSCAPAKLVPMGESSGCWTEGHESLRDPSWRKKLPPTIKARSLMETYQHHLQVSPFDAWPLSTYEAGYVVYKLMHNMFSACAQSWRTCLLAMCCCGGLCLTVLEPKLRPTTSKLGCINSPIWLLTKENNMKAKW